MRGCVFFSGCWSHAKPRSRERKRRGWFSVFGQACRGRESAGEAAVALHFRVGPGLWQCVGGVCAPSPPTPLPRFTGARGGFASVARAFQPEICPLRQAACRLRLRGVGAAGGLTRSREAAKGNAEVGFRCSVRRAADGSPRVRRRLRCIAVLGLACGFVLSCVAPSPPTLLPCFTGERGAVWVSRGGLRRRSGSSCRA